MSARKVAVITGAGRGIGRAIAHALSDVADLALCARTASQLDETARSLQGRTRVLTAAVDVSRREDVERLIAACVREYGRIDWLINNAGVAEIASLGDTSDEAWERTIGVNLSGPFFCARAALPELARSQGRIVNIGSISGTLGTPRMSAYNASKWGVNGLTKAWAEELKGQGVMVAAVLPGSVDTEMLRKSGFPPDMQPDDIAKVVRFLCAEAPFAMTGSLVEVFA